MPTELNESTEFKTPKEIMKLSFDDYEKENDMVINKILKLKKEIDEWMNYWEMLKQIYFKVV